MIIYPEVIYSSADYDAALAAHIDDPFPLAIVDIFWHGTRQYQKFIERDGIAKHQEYLRRGRVGVAQWQETMKACETGCGKLEARTLTYRRALFKNNTAGQSDRGAKQVEITVAAAVENFRKIEADNALGIKKLRERAKFARDQVQSYKSIVERLTAALVMYRHEHLESPTKEVTVPDRVNAPGVDWEADLPAPEITVKQPGHRTASVDDVQREFADDPAKPY